MVAPRSPSLIRVYTQAQQAQTWLQRYRQRRPMFACVLGFTETGLIPGISAAGATPDDRRYTAIADAEFLYCGSQIAPEYPLPPLTAGASPVMISRALLTGQDIPFCLLNAGLPQAPAVPCIDLGGVPARCLSSGRALDLNLVKHLWQQGLTWGTKLATEVGDGYLILAECVVGGTTTAQAVLTGLGLAVTGKVNSSHPTCNHAQKAALVQAGLAQIDSITDPFHLVAAIGDPMQIVVAGMGIAASRTCGVLLAGGTQMLAVAALMQAIATRQALHWQPDQIVVGTTRWVAEDPSGDTVGLAELVGTIPLLATQLCFAQSRHAQLRIYEAGYVKEGVGAGGCAIAAHLYQEWGQIQMLQAIEAVLDQELALKQR